VSRSFDLIAHRGDSAHAPENTLASIRGAILQGASAVEVDVRRCSDGEWVVFHDPTLRRTAGSRGRLARTSSKALYRFDVGSWFSPVFAGERIPTVEQVLDLCAGGRVRVFLDVKVSSGQKELARLLRRPAWRDLVWVGAGTAESLKRWRSLLPERPLFWVTGYRAPVTARRIAAARRIGLEGLLVYKRWASRSSVERVHGAGMKLYVWTVKTVSDFKSMRERGVDGIMSELWPHPSI